MWVVHQVKEDTEQCVGCCVSPSKVKVQDEGGELVFRER